MNNVKPLNPKALRLAVKRFDGIEYLMKRFGFLTEEELMNAIHRLNPQNAGDFIKELKKKQRKYAVSDAKKEVVIPEEEYKHDPELDFEVEEEDSGSVQVNSKDVERMLLELRQEEQQLSQKVCSLENEHKELAAKRRVLRSVFCEVDVILKKMEKEVAEQRQKVTLAYAEYQECASAMKNLGIEQQLHAVMLGEIRERIEAFERVTIFVYADGSISLENTEQPTIDECEFRIEFERLLALAESEDFTIKIVRNVARLHLIVASLSKKVELVFDSPELQKFWETVVVA